MVLVWAALLAIAAPTPVPRHESLDVGPFRVEREVLLTWPGLPSPGLSVAGDRRVIYRTRLSLRHEGWNRLSWATDVVLPSSNPWVVARAQRPGANPAPLGGHIVNRLALALPGPSMHVSVGRVAWAPGQGFLGRRGAARLPAMMLAGAF